jgi:hypothetical protein
VITQVKTPRDVFYQPQRLMVPLFQRPYVWSKEGQWAPLWDDVQRLAERRCNFEPQAPHFLGAVVMQQQMGSIGSLPIRTVIDGQQRLTTMQLMLSAVYEQVRLVGFESIARQVQDLVENPEHFTSHAEDRFKVWPTNRDRPAFNEVMSAVAPFEHGKLANAGTRMVAAHQFFSKSAEEWLAGPDKEKRAHALVETISNQLQIVVIELQADEDAQEIFETLNARGTPLTAADLIKNFVFQRLDVAPSQSEKAYHDYWEAFETPFWETEIASGRVTYSRSSLFLNQWLIAQSLKDVTAKEVFGQFKRHVADSNEPIDALLPKIRRNAEIYRSFTERAWSSTNILSRLELFIYRTSTLESEVVKPLVLWLEDPDRATVPSEQREKCLATVESWLIRRTCVRASTKAYNRIFVDLLNYLNQNPRETVGDFTERYFLQQDGPNDYWPGDAEVRRELTAMPIYKRFRRGRLRMLLEAIEDHRRGWTAQRPMHEQPVIRGTTTIEHIMPQEWSLNWPGADGENRSRQRDALVQTLGNLTLLTQSLNSRVSNGPWQGAKGKHAELRKNTSLLLTREVVELGVHGWTEDFIKERTERMIDDILEIWPVPAGHSGKTAASIERATPRVEVADLVSAGLVHPGQSLFARVQAHRGKPCQVSEDGSLYVGDRRYDTLSAAARAITGAQSEAGWWFWLVDVEGDRSMSDVRQEFVESLAIGGELVDAP